MVRWHLTIKEFQSVMGRKFSQMFWIFLTIGYIYISFGQKTSYFLYKISTHDDEMYSYGYIIENPD